MDLNLEKFNIDVSDYFLLQESDKNEITKIIIEIYSQVLDVEPMFISRYINIIRHSIRVCEQEEEYERAEIMRRVLIDLKIKYKRFIRKKEMY